MPKLTIIKINHAISALNALIELDKSKSFVLPSMVRITLASNARRLKEAVADSVATQTALFEKYGSPSKVPGQEGQLSVSQDDPSWAEFKPQYDALQAVEHDVAISAVPAKDVINSRRVKIRDERGQVTEETTENQVPIDLLVDLEVAGIITE